ncbi:phage minor head protein [Phocoenobacter skyensis]|uniref:Phage putative head morphogenesis protein, SPP1 gp7 family n=1 Tax=Phocoenobacter skyensis TaxID=97481 RepID=A0A1H8ABV0_9PAST|nr:colicin D domain-containing protein [Pasteurella skyensis]QLB23330.1 hypothetical protein A6B44_08970 [Pasteurella skyensis]SEM68255.1 phage putative head morphogenesis protein, SPP1 gp7 family [Pasteurella skyensis]
MASQKRTIEQKIIEDLVDHQILHFRYDAHLRKMARKNLNILQDNIIKRLLLADVKNLRKRELNKFINEVKKLINDKYQEIRIEQETELLEFLRVEHNNLVEVYNNYIDDDLLKPMSDDKLNSLDEALLISGVAIGDWWVKQSNDYFRRFQGTLRQGAFNNSDIESIISDFKSLAKSQLRNAETLIVTSVGKVSDAAHYALKEVGKKIFLGEEHVSVLDGRTSTSCQVRDGKRWDLDKKPIGHSVPYARPPLHPRCRSRLRLIFKCKLLNGNSKRITYEDWLEGKTKSQQDEILGKGKADLWRRNVITFSDMLDQTGRPLTLTELKRKFNPHFIEPVVDTKALKGARFQSSQLKRKFNKHAKHLGIDTTRNNSVTQKEFQNKIVDFMNSPNIIQKGVYKNSNNKVWYDPKTKVVVVFGKDNSFLTVLQLVEGETQYTKYLKEDFIW